MAIDTRAKRQNAAWVGYPGPVSVLPSGTIDAAVRAQIAWTYGGIPITPVTPGGSDIYDEVFVGTIHGTRIIGEPHVGGF